MGTVKQSKKRSGRTSTSESESGREEGVVGSEDLVDLVRRYVSSTFKPFNVLNN